MGTWHLGRGRSDTWGRPCEEPNMQFNSPSMNLSLNAGKAAAMPCKLCGALDPLKSSHIFPDFFIRSLERRIATGVHGQAQPMSILLSTRPEIEGGQKQRGYWEKIVGMKEALLCGKCEGRFSKYENYFREYFYGNAPAPLVKQRVGDVISGPIYGFDGMRECRVVHLDYVLFKLFVLSLLWRASVAQGKFFQGVSLGHAHEERLADALRSEDPGGEDAYAVGMFDLRDGASDMVDLIDNPEVARDQNNIRVCRMILGGFAFMVHVGAKGHAPPADLAKACLKTSGSVIMLVVEAAPIMKQWASRLRGANAFPTVI
jgi:hypothetical protein